MNSQNPNEHQNHSSGARTRFWVALGLSGLLHVLLGGGLALTPAKPKPSDSARTSVELLSPEELQALLKAQAAANNAKQIVDTGDKRMNEEVDPNAKYLSQFDQKVVKETRAARTGQFNNDAGQGQQAVQKSRAQEMAEFQELTPENENTAQDTAKAALESDVQTFKGGDFAVAPKTGLQAFNPSFRKLPVVPDPTAPSAQSGDGREVSATDDHLKDVPTGMQTMLSTREFVYYSYYNRIKAQLRQHWEPKIKEKFQKIVRQGRTIASDGNYKITKVIIILDEKGTLIRVQVVGASGIVDLDDAAVEAFRAAAPFPNPPKGIVEEDGTIKIRWD
ncbi:MAG: TonB family protein, partial [Bdellovibrionales bacterium]|nr:TonB family protein [Bdellovibrionales bacterium]